jgi:hypothetical protein
VDGSHARDRTQDSAVVMVDMPGRVTKRGRVPDDHDASSLFSFMRRLIVMRSAACARNDALPP